MEKHRGPVCTVKPLTFQRENGELQANPDDTWILTSSLQTLEKILITFLMFKPTSLWFK